MLIFTKSVTTLTMDLVTFLGMMLTIRCLAAFIFLANLDGKKAQDDVYSYPNWKFHFPRGSSIGLFVAIAMPLDLPRSNTYLAYYFEANYGLPDNTTYYDYPPLITRNIDRKLVYDAIERKMESNGYPGKACLLRTICESSIDSILHANGVLGDILHIIFTPSTSKNRGLSTEYDEAELSGKNRSCTKYTTDCPVSFVDLLTWIENSTQTF